MGFAMFPFAMGPFGALGPSTSLDATGATPVHTGAARVRLVSGGDYVKNDDGTLAEPNDAVDQHVAFLLGTDLGTFAPNLEIGNGVLRVRTNTAGSVNRIRDFVLRAIDPAVQQQIIRNVVVSASAFERDGTTVATYDVTYDKTGVLPR